MCEANAIAAAVILIGFFALIGWAVYLAHKNR